MPAREVNRAATVAGNLCTALKVPRSRNEARRGRLESERTILPAILIVLSVILNVVMNLNVMRIIAGASSASFVD